MLTLSYHNNPPSTKSWNHLAKAGALQAQLHSLSDLHYHLSQAYQFPRFPMAYRGLPNHDSYRNTAKFRQQQWLRNVEDDIKPTRQAELIAPGWQVGWAHHLRNLAPRPRDYVPFQSLTWRNGVFGYDPNARGYPQYDFQPPDPPLTLPYTPNFPKNEIVQMRMREQPDYGYFGDMYGY